MMPGGGGWWITENLRVESVFVRGLVSHTCGAIASHDRHTTTALDGLATGGCLDALFLPRLVISPFPRPRLVPSLLNPAPSTLFGHLLETNVQISEFNQINPSTSPMSLLPSYPRSSNGVNITGPIPQLPRLPTLMIQGGRLQRLESGTLSEFMSLCLRVVADDRFIQVDQEMLFEIILAAK
jgi:hypothetical protein